MKKRLLSILLVLTLAAGVFCAVPAQAADTPAAALSANAFNYLVNICKTEGELQNNTDYIVGGTSSLQGGGTVTFVLDYDITANALVLMVSTSGIGMDGYVAAMELPAGATAPFDEMMFSGENPIGAATIPTTYKPGDAVKFYHYEGAADRSKLEAYNQSCCAAMVEFLQNLLSKGGMTVRDLGLASKSPFVDVLSSDYFYQPVLWAVQQKITNGTSATTFSPETTCTRAQVVTFLWRYSGSPEPKSGSNPFEEDVNVNEWYGKAVLWAVEKGITNGVDAQHFGPDQGCTRGQVVTFLSRAMNGRPSGTKNPFRDVPANEYYYNAVLWAVEKGITNGVSDTLFGPDQTCTRGQIVTFLWRAAGKPAV